MGGGVAQSVLLLGCGPRRRKKLGLIPGRSKEISLFSIASRPVLGPTQPSVVWVSGSVSPQVKLQGRETNHSPPACVELELYLNSPAGFEIKVR
jgi:hypothetical protein